MALHEIHWNPHTRAMVLVRNHGSGPDNGCGWDGEEVRDVEALTVAFLSEGGSLDGWDDINEVVSIDGPIGIAGDWYAAGGSSFAAPTAASPVRHAARQRRSHSA